MADEVTEKKKIWESKTVWVNVITLAVILAQMQMGFIISPEEQVAVLAVVNLILRAVTSKPIA